jgi:glycosyltransferase involved in cell wall biosynthesis
MIYNPLPEISYTAAKERDFAYFGGPNRLKGFDVLCTALKLIKQRVHDHVRVHATGFNNISDFEMASMHKLGFVPYRRLEKEEFVKLYEHIRCVVVPSIWLETFSYVMIEALLAERIVVASELGAIPEVSRGCKGLFLCPPGDSTVLSEKLLEVRDMSEEVAADLGSRNREKIIERFSNRESTLRFISVLDQVSSH